MKKLTWDHVNTLNRCEKMYRKALPHYNDPSVIRGMESDIHNIVVIKQQVTFFLHHPALPFGVAS